MIGHLVCATILYTLAFIAGIMYLTYVYNGNDEPEVAHSLSYGFWVLFAAGSGFLSLYFEGGLS